jgi:tetratricopeptide (TPR) repeat protein
VEEHRQKGAVFNQVGSEAFMDRSLTLIKMADLLEKEDVKEEAFASAKPAYEALRKYSESRYRTSRYVTLLVDHGRGPEAELVVIEELAAMSQPALRANNTRTDMMAALAYIYNQASLHADVVKLLDDSDMWDVRDLADAERVSFDSNPLLLIAAESLHAVGRVDEASLLLDRVLQSYPGEDDAYALLLEIGGEDVVEKLNALHAKNRFQERPLIWKAQFFLNSEKLDEAEETIKSAIAIDPSDGEQGKGDRMRAYAVLADIMAKKGNDKQADFLRGVVRSIRISETGDDWWAVGMQKRAIAIYEASLKEFADAYCIQSRLALRYSEMGDFEKAAEHYRRAFELMPESFGRVESHCFGCEGAFSGDLAQGIAEKVFLQLAVEMPDRAQVFYLLGYLRQQQSREADAAEQYAKAVQIDPLYINAWKNLGEVADEAGLSTERKDEIQFALYRLNPAGGNLRQVSNLAKLWDTALDVEKTYEAPETGPVFALEFDESGPNANRSYHYGSHSREQGPRTQLAKNETINGVTSVLEGLLGR